MQRYQSHKIVEAAKVVAWNTIDNAAFPYTAVFEDGSDLQLTGKDGDRIRQMASGPITTGWLVVYADGYVSWSPAKAFEEGYDLVQPSSGKSKIVGYRELNDAEISQMNNIKEHGRLIGTVVEYMRSQPGYDQRWVSIGATELQQGLMALTRAVAKPEFF